MEILVLIAAVLMGVVIKGCFVYILWNWLLVGLIGLALPTIGFTLACVIGFILTILFN